MAVKEAQIIHVEIVQNDIEHRITLGEFKGLLLNKIGSVALTMTKKQFERQVSSAIDRVIQQIRDEIR